MKLKRIAYHDDGVFSILYNEDKPFCFTLEHAYPTANNYAAKVIAGKYECVRGQHRLEHGPEFETFEVTGVYGHSGILFHAGNWNADSDGCILLGDSIGTSPQGKIVTNSRATFIKFMNLQNGVNAFELEVLG